MIRNRFARLDVPRMLERLRIEAKPKADGRAYQASCPSPEHADNSPSWWIRSIPGEPYHAAHKCQGCGFGGGPILLACTVLGIDEDEAREWLSDLAAPPPLPSKIEIEVKSVVRGYRPFVLPDCVQLGVPFDEWPEKHREYLLARNVHPSAVERWGLGFVPDRGRGVSHHRLNGRIVFPIRDSSGRVCSYTARHHMHKHRLRYLEPKEDEGAARCIFGEQHWAGRRTVFVTEGAFDAIAVDAITRSDENAVAALRGSSPHSTTLNKLMLFDRVFVLTDPDKAGAKAQKLIAACGLHAYVRPIELAAGADPAKLYETADGRAYLTEQITRAIHVSAA